MDNFGLHDKIDIKNREFHIHTGTVVEKKTVISEVFEKGMFLTSKEYAFELRNDSQQLNYDFLNKITRDFHNSIIDEIQALYRIEEKLSHYRHATSQYHLGCLFLKRNLYDEAIKQFSKAIDQDNKFVRSYMGLGVAFLKSKQYQDAAKVFEKALSLGEKYPDLLNYLGLSYLFMGEFEHATSLFKEAITINANYVESQFNLGVALYKSALEGVKDPKAVAVPARVSIFLKQVRDIDKYRSEYWQKQFNQLLELLKDNNHDIIIPEIEKFQLKLVDFSSEKDRIYEFFLRFLFGGAELDLETIDKYENHFYVSEKNVKQYPDYWNDLGIFHLIKSRGLYLKALSEFEKAIELAPNFRTAQEYHDMIKSNEKGFLILLRAILK